MFSLIIDRYCSIKKTLRFRKLFALLKHCFLSHFCLFFSFTGHNRTIFVYSNCLISIRNSAFNQSYKNIRVMHEYLTRIVRLTLSPTHWILFVRHGIKNLNIFQRVYSSLTFLQPRLSAVFEIQFLFECYIQGAKH